MFGFGAADQVTVVLTGSFDERGDVLPADGVLGGEVKDAVVVVENFGDLDGLHGATTWQFAMMS